MAIQDTSLCNTDLLQPAKFLFSIPRLTSTQFFCQSVTVPGVDTQSILQSTSYSDLPIPGDKLVYEPITINFLIDEELNSWFDIYDWMRGIAFPKNNEEYKNLKHQSRYSEQTKYPQYADAELITLSANNNAKMKFHFVDLFPVSLSGFTMDIRLSSENTLTAQAVFKFKRMELLKV
jgi:hypothetical protein